MHFPLSCRIFSSVFVLFGLACGPNHNTQVEKSNESFTLEQFQDNPPSSLLTEVTQFSREDLFSQGQVQLQRIIFDLQKQNKIVSLNKANIFKSGLARIENAIKASIQKNSSLSKEKISVFTSNFTSPPFELEFRNLNPVPTDFTPEWMNYSDSRQIRALSQQHFQITFANFANYRLGGGWNTHGNVQEEQMVHQCPDFMLLLALNNPSRHQHLLHTRKNSELSPYSEEIKYASRDSASPLLITQLRFIQKLTYPYEHGNNPGMPKSSKFSIRDSLWNLDQALDDTPDAPPVNMIALAAPELRPQERGKPYSLELIRDLFNNAYAAYAIVKANDLQNQRHSFIYLGRWGAGAFGHNLNMVIAIQSLAARLVFTEKDHVQFTGITSEEARPALELLKTVYKKLDNNKDSLGASSKLKPILVDELLTDIYSEIKTNLNWHTKNVNKK